MSFFNIFNSDKVEAKSAQDSARTLNRLVPGYWPESEGVDEELYDGLIKDPVRDPKIVKERAPEVLDIVGKVLEPLFGRMQAIADEQRAVSENPASTSGMASSVLNEAARGASSQGITEQSKIPADVAPVMPDLPTVDQPAAPDIPGSSSMPAQPDVPPVTKGS